MKRNNQPSPEYFAGFHHGVINTAGRIQDEIEEHRGKIDRRLLRPISDLVEDLIDDERAKHVAAMSGTKRDDLRGELLPCPFCGAGGKFEQTEAMPASEYFFWHVECRDCECRTATIDTKKQAAELWNRREVTP